jgi:hypothetical protein
MKTFAEQNSVKPDQVDKLDPDQVFVASFDYELKPKRRWRLFLTTILLEWSLERADDWKVAGDESDEEGEPARMQNVNVKRYKDKPDITPSILLDAHDYREAHLDRPVVRLTVGDGTAYFISSDKGRIIDKQSHF